MSNDDDIFDSVVFLEEEYQEFGRQEALNDPNFGHDDDSFELGKKNGFEFFKEVGFYAGFATEALKKDISSTKALDHLQAILSIANGLSFENEDNQDPHRDLKLLQGHFKVACSLLRLNVKYSTEKGPNLSF